MGKYVIKHDRPNCIGCAACEAVCSKFWEMNADGKSDVKGAKANAEGWHELEIAEEDLQCNKEAAESCPVNVIHIDDEEGKRII